MTQPNEEDGERKTKVVKSSTVTASSSTVLGTLRKQTWKNKSISFKSFLFQSFQLAGQLVSLNLLSLLPNMLLYSSQANLLPVISVAGWSLLLCLCPNPFCHLFANPCLSSPSKAQWNFSSSGGVVQTAWFLGMENLASMLALRLTAWVSLGKFIKLSEPQSPHL